MNHKLISADDNKSLTLHNQYGPVFCPYQQSIVPCGTCCALFYIGSELKTSVRSTSVTLGCAKVTLYLPLEVVNAKTT